MHTICTVKVLKNAVLGMAVFGTYDYVTLYLLANTSSSSSSSHDANRHAEDVRERNTSPQQQQQQQQVSLQLQQGFESDPSIATAHDASIPVFAHAGAGLCAGMAHSAVVVLWELVTKQHQHWHFVRRLKVMLQHSVGYAALFGTYEGVRRLLEYTYFYNLQRLRQRPPQATSSSSHVVKVQSFLNPLLWHDADMPLARWTFAFLAGGVAGEVYQIVTLAMSQSSVFFSRRHGPSSWDWRKIKVRRPTAASFVLTGLCFVAFEFGGDLTERALTSDQQ